MLQKDNGPRSHVQRKRTRARARRTRCGCGEVRGKRAHGLVDGKQQLRGLRPRSGSNGTNDSEAWRKQQQQQQPKEAEETKEKEKGLNDSSSSSSSTSTSRSCRTSSRSCGTRRSCCGRVFLLLVSVQDETPSRLVVVVPLSYIGHPRIHNNDKGGGHLQNGDRNRDRNRVPKPTGGRVGLLPGRTQCLFGGNGSRVCLCVCVRRAKHEPQPRRVPRSKRTVGGLFVQDAEHHRTGSVHGRNGSLSSRRGRGRELFDRLCDRGDDGSQRVRCSVIQPGTIPGKEKHCNAIQ
mmetsp:Transcript_2902/g.7907  ORF Transcript_2902/g.7907 Transcript_2902/m.7907 type:complete len:291 (-) Transcript_2902:203-1075(-)